MIQAGRSLTARSLQKDLETRARSGTVTNCDLFDGFWESVCRPTFDGKAVCFSGRADLLGIICRLDNLPLCVGERRCVVGRRQSRWSPRPAALLCLEVALHKFPPARRGIVTNCEDHCLCRASRGLMLCNYRSGRFDYLVRGIWWRPRRPRFQKIGAEFTQISRK